MTTVELPLPAKTATRGRECVGALSAGGLGGLVVFGAGVLDVIVGLMYFIYSLARMLPSVSYHGTWGGILIALTGGLGIAACLKHNKIIIKVLLALSAVSLFLVVFYFFFGYVLDLRKTEDDVHLQETIIMLSVLATLGFIATLILFTTASVTIFCPGHPRLKQVKLLTEAQKAKKIKHSASTRTGVEVLPDNLKMVERNRFYSSIDKTNEIKPEYANDSHTIPLERNGSYPIVQTSTTSLIHKDDYVNAQPHAGTSMQKENYVNAHLANGGEKEQYMNSQSFTRSREGSVTYDDPIDVEVPPEGADHYEKVEATPLGGMRSLANGHVNGRPPARGMVDYDDATSQASPIGGRRKYPNGHANGERKFDYDDARSDATPIGLKERYANVDSNTKPGAGKVHYDDAQSEASPIGSRKQYTQDVVGQSDMAVYETYSQVNTSINAP